MLNQISRSRGAVERPQEAAQPLAAFDPMDGLRLGCTVDQPVAKALMISIQVVAGSELVDGVP